MDSKNSKDINKKIFQAIIFISLLSCYGFLIANKADLTTTDLGRHIENGKVAINSIFSNAETFNQLVKTNFYSYTSPSYPFINHHWLSGIIFYLVEKFLGFNGLSLLSIVFSLIAFTLFFKLAQKNSNFTISSLTALLLIPLIAERKEIRPEVFSYFFIALFLWILWHHHKGLISNRWLTALPLMGIVWVNIHIYFIFGLFLIGVFLLEEIIIPTLRNKKNIKNLSLAFVATALSFLLQPNGLKGALCPFFIFTDYGYQIVENQSIWFLQKIVTINNSNILLCEIIFLLLIFSFIFLFFIDRKKFSFTFFLLGTAFGIMAFLMLRNFTIFGLFALVILAYNLDKIFKKIHLKPGVVETIVLISFLIIVSFGVINGNQEIFNQNKGLGLAPNNNASAIFFKKENVKGPIFNNFDIGSYLDYYLFSQEKVFVDNRPDAYSVSFFQKIYIPMQEDDNVWKEQDKKYNFNAIFFSYYDYTPWGQKFLITRIGDKNWAPIFADQYAIIFLKRNDLNKNLIEKYEIPKNFFSIKKTD